VTVAGAIQRVDPLLELLANYATTMTFDDLDDATVHAASLRLVDTVGALMAGFDGPPCGIARSLAEQLPTSAGSTILGTTTRTSPDLAAFTNATTARYAESNDVYHGPGSAGGHPSDVIMPVIAAAEYAHASGEKLLLAIVLAYEVYLRFSDATKIPGFDSATFAAIGSAVGAGAVFDLNTDQMRQCISMSVVANNALRQSRVEHLSMWKAAAAGQAGRGGVFAALLASAGMAAPARPFAGTCGWLNAVAQSPITLGALGGRETRFKVHDTLIKPRASCATTISSILAAERAHAAADGPVEPASVLVETYRHALERTATGEHHWHPDNRETADHSIPYVVAATLLDGTVGAEQFDDGHLADPRLRRILEKVTVVEDEEFTKRYTNRPVQHHTRVTVRTTDGRVFHGESGGELGDLSTVMTDNEVTAKFRRVADLKLGADRSEKVAEMLWNIAGTADIAALPRELVLR